MSTRAVRDGDSYVINGRKQWCSYGVEAEYIVLMARTAGDRGASGISAFVLEPKKMKGITFGRHERKMGWRGAPNTPIFLDNVRVPVENLVGEEGKGFRASLRALDLNRPTIGAQCVGLAQGRARRLGRVRQGAQAVQAADRRLPGRPVHARRHGDGHRGVARAGLRMRPGLATRATGTSSTCWRAWRSASPATWR
jgi:alkylation response protein AidB-like acyl-CoA dehydrogenase